MHDSPPAEQLQRVGLFPLPDLTLMPHQLLPLHVFEPRYRQLVDDACDGQGLIAIPRLRPGYEPHYHGNPALHPVCGLGRIVQQDQLEDGRSNILVLGLRRVRLVEEFRGPPYRMGRVEEVRDSSPSAPLAHARLIATLQRLSAELRHDLDASELALVKAAEAAAEGATAQLDYLAGSFVRDADLRQQLLEETDPSVRLLRWTAALQERASVTQLDTERQRDWN